MTMCCILQSFVNIGGQDRIDHAFEIELKNKRLRGTLVCPNGRQPQEN
jgi:hypothetical protein